MSDNNNPDLNFTQNEQSSQNPQIPPQQPGGQPFVPPHQQQTPPQYMEQNPRPNPTMAPYQPYPQQQPLFPQQPKDPKKGLAIASLVLGIVSLVFGCAFYLAIPCGIIAIILGAVSVKSTAKGMAIAGIILGSLGIVASVIFFIVLIASGVIEQYTNMYSSFY